MRDKLEGAALAFVLVAMVLSGLMGMNLLAGICGAAALLLVIKSFIGA